MNKVIVTYGQLNELASEASRERRSFLATCLEMYAPQVPESPEPEWEEVPMDTFHVVHMVEDGKAALADNRSAPYAPFLIVLNEGFNGLYKIEDGKIWRKKA